MPVFWLFSSLLTDVALMLMLMAILPMRSKPAYALCYLALTVAAWAVHDYVVVRALLHTVLGVVVIPCILYDAHPNQKALATTFAVLSFFIGETLANSISVYAGVPIVWSASVPEHWGLILSTRLVAVVWIVVSAVLVRALLMRLNGEGGKGSTWRFTAVPALQAILVIVFYVTVWRWWGVLSASFAFHAALCVVCAACFFSDLMLFAGMEWYLAASAARERARMLEAQLQTYLDEYSAKLDEIETTARIRHDIRNHLQVVDALIERGDTDLALEYVGRAVEGIEGAAREGFRLYSGRWR